MKSNGARKALDNFYAKTAKKLRGKTRKNASPEKEVEKECVHWMRVQGWSVEIYSAKATYDPRRGVWRNQSMKAGTCDCQGVAPGGIFAAIEFKSPGRLSTFNQPKNYRQKEYILNKINVGAFACVVDSVNRLREIYAGFCQALQTSPDAAKVFLLKSLP